MEEKTIRDQLDEIIGEICDHYCKYPAIADGKAFAEATEQDEMTDLAQAILDGYCQKCPLCKI